MGGVCGSADELRAAVRQHAAEGADAVKVMATGGMTTPDFPAWRPQFTPLEIRAVVAAAREYGLPVAAHAHGVDRIRSAVDAGVDTLEHCTWQTAAGRDG
jgi:imidazolonepropionase-like amidohydrolase